MRQKYDADRERDMPIVARVAEVAERRGVSMAQVALAWHWVRGVEAPLVGCSKPERVDEAVAALDVELTADEADYLEEPYMAHELVGPVARPGEKPLAGTTNPNAKQQAWTLCNSEGLGDAGHGGAPGGYRRDADRRSANAISPDMSTHAFDAEGQPRSARNV